MSINTGNLPESTGPIHLDGNGHSTANGGGRRALTPSPEAIRALPADFVKKHRVLPLEIFGGTIRVATAELGNGRVIDDIRLLSGLEVEEISAPVDELMERIAELYQVTVEQIVENLS